MLSCKNVYNKLMLHALEITRDKDKLQDLMIEGCSSFLEFYEDHPMIESLETAIFYMDQYAIRMNL